MCDVCKAEGRNFEFNCGGDSKLKTARLYKVYVGRVAAIKVCKLCDIKLFMMGENRFLQSNINFAASMVASKGSFFD